MRLAICACCAAVALAGGCVRAGFDPARGDLATAGDGGSAGDSGSSGDVAVDAAWVNPVPGAILCFTEGSSDGVTVRDATGSGRDATCMGGGCPKTVPGVHGQALSFDGSGKYLEVPLADGASRPASAFSVSVWVRIPSQPPGLVAIAGVPQADTSTLNTWEMFVTDVPNLYFKLNDVSKPTSGPVSAPAMPLLGGFHHVAGTWDGTTVRIHVDGVEVAKTSYDSVSYIAAPTMLVGADSNTGVLGAYLTGDIDELCLYGRALSGSEIKALAAR